MGAQWVAHYIDDFITIGAPDSLECQENTVLMHAACDRMGFPVEPEKDKGPATTLPFLGIELYSIALELRRQTNASEGSAKFLEKSPQLQKERASLFNWASLTRL